MGLLVAKNFRALHGDAVATWMVWYKFLLGLPSLSMGWDQSPVDHNGMGWKLLCVMMERDGKFMVLGWDGMGNHCPMLSFSAMARTIPWHISL